MSGEQSTPEAIDLTVYSVGDRVRYDDYLATVLERIPSDRAGSDDYLVRWDDGGKITIVWGSDLVPVAVCLCTGWDGCPAPSACGTPFGCYCGL